MSHISRVKTKMSSSDSVRSALKDLGQAFQETSGPDGKAQFAVYPRGGYPAIVIKEAQGSFEVSAYWDELPAGMSQQSFLGALTQRYAYFTVKKKLQAEGYELKEQREKGTIRLVAIRRVIRQRGIEEQEIEGRISKEGDVSIAVRGVRGSRCLDVSRGLEGALGEVTERELTLEYLAPDPDKPKPDCVAVALIPPKEKARLHRAAELE